MAPPSFYSLFLRELRIRHEWQPSRKRDRQPAVQWTIRDAQERIVEQVGENEDGQVTWRKLHT